MNRRKITRWFYMLLVCSLFLTGCGSNGNSLKKFTCSDGTFSFYAPSDFVVEQDEKGILKLGAPGEVDLGILAQRMEKGDGAEVRDLDSFVAMYHELIKGMISQSNGIREEKFQLEDSQPISVKAESMEVPGSGESGMVFLLYVEYEKSFVVVSVTGIAGEYKKRIDEIQKGLVVLKEN